MKQKNFTFYVRTLFQKNVVCDALSVFFLVSSFLFAPVSFAQKSQATWQKHLEYLKNAAAKDCVGDLTQLKLLKYNYKGEIKSEKDKSRVIEAFFSDKAPIVSVSSNLVISDTTYTDTDIKIRQKRYPKFEILTVRQMVDGGKLTEDSIVKIKQGFYENVKIGFGYLEMDWSYKGKKFHSLGIILNDSIPVDPITSGLFTSGNTIVNSRNCIDDK